MKLGTFKNCTQYQNPMDYNDECTKIKYTHIRYLSLSTMCTNNTVTFIDSYQTHAIWSGGYKEYHEEGDYQQQLRRPMNFSTEYEHAYDFLFMENQGRLNRARFHCGGAWNRIQ